MKDKLYITTAIPYANAKPHIGNSLDYLLADIWARYFRQNGKEVRFQTGTDEHGNKIAQKAKDLNLEPQAYVDQTHVNFKNMIQKMNISATDFIRTTDPRHVKAVQEIWKKLSPYIYKGTYEGWYSVGEEAFVSDKVAAANGGISPDHGVPYERLSEENYYFKLSEFVPKIREAIESDELKIVPENRKIEILNLIDEGVEDLSISRPRKSLSWGIPVPGDDSQVMYVWIDALSNYITVLGYPDGDGWQSYWPADIQIVGKDILRFHAIIWPAILMGLDLPLPKTILAHGHISSGGKKMSKTVGNVIDPIEVIDNYGLDAFRYYMARHIPTQDDGDFTFERFETAYNTELGNDLGNLVSRVASMVQKYEAGVIGDVKGGENDISLYREAIEELRFNEALDIVWQNIREDNKYIEIVKPWEIAKKAKTDKDAEEHLSEVLQKCVGSLMQISDLLQPFMPETAAKINNMFVSGTVTENEPLFPKIHLHTEESKSAHNSKPDEKPAQKK